MFNRTWDATGLDISRHNGIGMAIGGDVWKKQASG